MVQSVLKGYQMLQLIIFNLPITFQAFFQIILSLIVIGSMVDVIKYFLRGGGGK